MNKLVSDHDATTRRNLSTNNNDELPAPWRYLNGAVGAPKFVMGPGVGFGVERIAD